MHCRYAFQDAVNACIFGFPSGHEQQVKYALEPCCDVIRYEGQQNLVMKIIAQLAYHRQEGDGQMAWQGAYQKDSEKLPAQWLRTWIGHPTLPKK